ncbi:MULTISPECIES: hypothetical protein [unclassified Streptomyces]|uniref:hypothetical protein n=1 Tax=unclassified Streptomyces TaxID=2593676 RepID=UPI00333478E4
MPTRGRKPADAAAADETIAAAVPAIAVEETGPVPTENKTADTDEVEEAGPAPAETKARTQAPPDVAPLEPPAPPQVATTPITPGPEGTVPAQLDGRIVDEATGEMPSAPEEVFEALPPYGYLCRSRVRLIEHVGMGTYGTPSTRLLVPAGADVRREDADRITARLREQLGE